MAKSWNQALWFHLRWAWRELASRWARTALTVSGVASAILVLVGIQGFFHGYERALDRSIKGLGYEVLVTAKGCPYEAATLVLSGGDIPMYVDDTVAQQILRHPDVDMATQLFLQSVPAPDTDGFYVIAGVDDSFRALKPWVEIQSGDWFASESAEQVILGYNAATVLEREVGDVVSLPTVPGRFEVVGILNRTGTQDDGAIFLPLARAQKAFDRKGKLTGLGVKVKDFERLDQFLADVQELPSVQVVTLAQVKGTLLNLIGAARALALTIGCLALLVATGGLVNTILISVFERMRELGILKAMGASASRLFAVVAAEAVLIALMGSLIGFFAALMLVRVLEAVLRRMLPFVPEGPIVEIGLSSLWQFLILGLFVSVVAGVWPALKAARARPVLTIRGGS